METSKIEARIEGDRLIVSLPMETPTLSSTGKSLIVASTHGTQPTGVMVDGKEVKLTVSAFIKR